MIKLLILFAIVILSATLGMALSNEKKRRMKIFSQFYEFNEKLILNMRYGKEKINTVAEEFDYVKRYLNGAKIVKGEEGKFVADYIDNLGKTDPYSQIEYLTERREGLKKYKQQSEENYKRYGSLYFKLCLMGGILIAVLLA